MSVTLQSFRQISGNSGRSVVLNEKLPGELKLGGQILKPGKMQNQQARQALCDAFKGEDKYVPLLDFIKEELGIKGDSVSAKPLTKREIRDILKNVDDKFREMGGGLYEASHEIGKGFVPMSTSDLYVLSQLPKEERDALISDFNNATEAKDDGSRERAIVKAQVKIAQWKGERASEQLGNVIRDILQGSGMTNSVTALLQLAESMKEESLGSEEEKMLKASLTRLVAEIRKGVTENVAGQSYVNTGAIAGGAELAKKFMTALAEARGNLSLKGVLMANAAKPGPLEGLSGGGGELSEVNREMVEREATEYARISVNEDTAWMADARLETKANADMLGAVREAKAHATAILSRIASENNPLKALIDLKLQGDPEKTLKANLNEARRMLASYLPSSFSFPSSEDFKSQMASLLSSRIQGWTDGKDIGGYGSKLRQLEKEIPELLNLFKGRIEAVAVEVKNQLKSQSEEYALKLAGGDLSRVPQIAHGLMQAQEMKAALGKAIQAYLYADAGAGQDGAAIGNSIGEAIKSVIEKNDRMLGVLNEKIRADEDLSEFLSANSHYSTAGSRSTIEAMLQSELQKARGESYLHLGAFDSKKTQADILAAVKLEMDKFQGPRIIKQQKKATKNWQNRLDSFESAVKGMEKTVQEMLNSFGVPENDRPSFVELFQRIVGETRQRIESEKPVSKTDFEKQFPKFSSDEQNAIKKKFLDEAATKWGRLKEEQKIAENRRAHTRAAITAAEFVQKAFAGLPGHDVKDEFRNRLQLVFEQVAKGYLQTAGDHSSEGLKQSIQKYSESLRGLHGGFAAVNEEAQRKNTGMPSNAVDRLQQLADNALDAYLKRLESVSSPQELLEMDGKAINVYRNELDGVVAEEIEIARQLDKKHTVESFEKLALGFQHAIENGQGLELDKEAFYQKLPGQVRAEIGKQAYAKLKEFYLMPENAQRSFADLKKELVSLMSRGFKNQEAQRVYANCQKLKRNVSFDDANGKTLRSRFDTSVGRELFSYLSNPDDYKKTHLTKGFFFGSDTVSDKMKHWRGSSANG